MKKYLHTVLLNTALWITVLIIGSLLAVAGITLFVLTLFAETVVNVRLYLLSTLQRRKK
jgi:hypothetical protein